LQARCDGFDLHAGVTVGGDDRARLEQLSRHLLRPPIAQERLTRRPDGTVIMALETPWRDGTTHLLAHSTVVAPVDGLVAMGLLTVEHLEDWRRGRVP
jgi:hypothetical protein